MSRPPLVVGRITGWGTALPEQVVTNADLEAHLDTSHTWIVERTGIHERRVGGSTGELAAVAAERALTAAGCPPSEVELVLLATTTPERLMPATAGAVVRHLGTTAGAADLNVACSGFVYALVAGFGYLATGLRRVLVVGAESMHRIVDWADRGTAVLFGDGAGAVLLEAGGPPAPGAPGLLAHDLGTDAGTEELLVCEHGGTIRMEGREVFRFAVRAVVASVARTLEAAGVAPGEVDVVVPHQANERIVAAVCERLDIPAERAVVTIAGTGNTSAASIPYSLAHAVDAHRVPPGGLVLLAGFGAGMSWGTALLRWPEQEEAA